MIKKLISNCNLVDEVYLNDNISANLLSDKCNSNNHGH